MDTGEVDELAEPQPMTPVEDLVMTSSPSSQNGGPSTSETTPPSVEPARSSAATQTEKSLDWPKLWSDSAGNHNELIATEPDPVPTAVRADLVKKAKDARKLLVLNGRVCATGAANDRCKVLSHRVLSILAENADVLHTKTFRESDKMKNLIGIAQLLYHSESKYSSVAHHVLKSSLDSVEKRQARFYEGKEPSVVIKDTPPADRAPKADAKPAALPGKTFWNPQCRLIQEEASTSKSSSGSASPLVAPRPLTATPTHRSSTQTTSSGSGWSIPASNDNGWGSSSSTDWSQPVTTTSTGWNTPADPKPASSTQDEGATASKIASLQEQLDALRKEMKNGGSDRPRRGAQRGRNFGRGRGYRIRCSPSPLTNHKRPHEEISNNLQKDEEDWKKTALEWKRKYEILEGKHAKTQEELHELRRLVEGFYLNALQLKQKNPSFK
ncbi:Oidioi.mRNA.OKI2018_I69.PAR.g12933.t1.cds [Oikopleura dioica]|uniref:Oidioi.mRNA.OKI2018_I69.PAR.g12933.t1.cds n=1 Tax=Oikopleura dioica TaxID=34765 RepID=A0ABN7S2C8_OIKDI|nr:Oidioi.mRNA.OKI2018_I69.PAR.g12933.t1.cds [Oikopleura dioica]